MAAGNSRTPEQVRGEVVAERERLADAVDSLRAEVKEATDIRIEGAETTFPWPLGAPSEPGSSWPVESARR